MYFEKVIAFHAVFRCEFLLQAYVRFMQANEYQPMPSIQGKLWQAEALPVHLNVTAVWQTDQDALVVLSLGMIGAYDAVADVTKAIIQ